MQNQEQQWQAAFVAQDPGNHEAHFQHWNKMLANPAIINRTVLIDGVVVGSVGSWLMENVRQITFWFGSEYCGKGYATAAVKSFLELVNERPIEGRCAFDNFGSARVMEKCGFVKVGTDNYFANARGKEIMEFIFQLT